MARFWFYCGRIVETRGDEHLLCTRVLGHDGAHTNPSKYTFLSHDDRTAIQRTFDCEAEFTMDGGRA